MRIGKNAVVMIDYTLRNTGGEIIDSTSGKESLPYLHGTGSLIPGLENALEGKEAGEKLRVKIMPEDAYGVRDEKLVQVVPQSAFGGNEVKVGSQFRTSAQSVVTVTKVEGDQVTVDGNHMLAGVVLDFEVAIKDVRAATKEELAHGHVHGPGGHHHH